MSYCAGNVGETVEQQINGAFDEMEKRLALLGLSLENVVQMDCLFRDVWNIPAMEKVITLVSQARVEIIGGDPKWTLIVYHIRGGVVNIISYLFRNIAKR